MKIDGNLIASEIREKLKKKIAELSSRKITPNLAVVLVGHDPASLAYVGRKQKVGTQIGAKVTLFHYPALEKDNLAKLVGKLNHDPQVQGVIIQKPVPVDMLREELDLMVIPQKDVDGFHPESAFNPPVAEAVHKILESVRRMVITENNSNGSFPKWLNKQHILVIGRGETAGKPIARFLKKMKIKFTVAHSGTKDLEKECLKADIIISCVGKPNIVRHNMVLKNTILIGVGLHAENGKLAADYNQEEIAPRVSCYTPVPGGVGPVNVACLFQNLVKAASCQD